MKQGRQRQFLMGIFAFFLPVLILCIAMASRQICPFGGNALLDWDAKLQYKDYYAYLWDVLHGNASLDYSFSKALGGGMIGLFSYYVSSFFNLFLIFFKKSQILEYISLAFICKTGLSGVTSYIYLKRRFALKDSYSILLSLSYALMEYNMVYCRNLMWLDGAFLLPLVCLGAYDCIERKGRIMLPLTVALAILSNWYSGYMVCFMVVIYAVFELLVLKERTGFPEIARSFGRFVLHLMAGVAMSCVILLPSLLSLMGGRAEFTFITGDRNMTPLHFFSGFVINARYNRQNAPVIYTGGLCLLLVVYSFFWKENTWRNRIGNAVLLLFLMAGYLFKDMELLWTAYVNSTSYYFRFSFVFSFAMIVIAASTLARMQEKALAFRWQDFAKSLLLVYAVFAALYLKNELYDSFSKNKLLENGIFLFFMLLYAVLLYLHSNRLWKYVVLTTILSVELLYNANQALYTFVLKVSDYKEYAQEMRTVVEDLKDRTKDFFRFEKKYNYILLLGDRDISTCESLWFGYHSIENYSSTYDRRTDRFMANMGVSDYPGKDMFALETYWNDSSPLTDTMLGIRYVLYDRDLYGYKKLQDNAGITKTDGSDAGYACYENERALPFAYGIAASAPTSLNYGEDPFINQNRLASTAIGQTVEVYEKQTVEHVKTEEIPFEEIDPQILKKRKDDEGPVTEDTYQIVAAEDGALYLYVDGWKNHNNLTDVNCEVYVDGRLLQNTCARQQVNIMSLGTFKKGDKVTVAIRHLTKTKEDHTLYVYRVNEAAYDLLYRKLSAVQFEQLDVKDGKITAESNFDQSTKMLFTMPYNDGWSCEIDGEEVPIGIYADTFATVEVPAGTHTIVMRYHTPGLTVSAGISAAALVVWLMWVLAGSRRRKEEHE